MALSNKNPGVKAQSCLFLYRVFKNFEPSTVPKKPALLLIPSIIKLTSESSDEVREAAFTALGALLKAMGRQKGLLGDLEQDKLKMTKVFLIYIKSIIK